MSRVAALLTAVAGKLRAARDEANRPVFTEVRVELDRYDLADLVNDSTRAPTARVCFMRSKPVKREDGGLDLDVSVAIVVVAGRQGRANPELSSADLAALGLLDRCTVELMFDPYVGLGQLQAADIGDQLVAVSEQSNKHAVAIALLETKWRLLDAHIARPAIQAAIETGRNRWTPDGIAIGDGEPEPPRTAGDGT